MKIYMNELIKGARQAKGVAVVIDVFRAFSLEAYLMHNGAKEIYAVGKEETARKWKEAHPDYILIGERGGVKLPGYDYGNSPSQTKNADMKGKTIIHTTSAGTQGIVNAAHCKQVITGSLANAKAIANYLKKMQPEEVTLIAMGVMGTKSAPEDGLCARYIKSLLEENPLDMEEEIAILRQTPEAKKFFEIRTQNVFPMEDYEMCVAYDSIDLVLQANKIEEDVFCVRRMDHAI